MAGSLVTGQVRAYDLIRTMSADGHTTGLGEAFAHDGRIFKPCTFFISCTTKPTGAPSTPKST